MPTLPIALADFRLGIERLTAETKALDPHEPRVHLKGFTRRVGRQVRRADPGQLVFLRGVQAGLGQASRDQFRLPLPGAMIKEESQQRYAGGLVSGALLHEWLRGDRRPASSLDPLYAYGQALGSQVNQHHLCAQDPARRRLAHRVSCVHVEQRHGAIELHTEMFLVAWLLRVCGCTADQIDLDDYLGDRAARWRWKPPRGGTTSAPPR